MRTVAPRRAARIASSPQPVPISRTRLPSPTPAWSSSRSILRTWARGRSRRSLRRRRRDRTSSSWSRRGTAGTGRWTGRSGARRCRGCWPRPRRTARGRRATYSRRAAATARGTSVPMSAASTVRKPAEVARRPTRRSGRPRRTRSARPGRSGRRTPRARHDVISGPPRPRVSALEAHVTSQPARRRRRNRRRATRDAIAARGPVGTMSSPGQRWPEVGSAVEGHRETPSWWWSGRGRTGSRRSQSRMPCIRIRSAPRIAAGAARAAAGVGTASRQRGAEHLAVVGVQGDGDVQPVTGDRYGELVAAVGRRGTARRTSPCRSWPGPARRGARGRRAGRRRCCAPRRRRRLARRPRRSTRTR